MQTGQRIISKQNWLVIAEFEWLKNFHRLFYISGNLYDNLNWFKVMRYQNIEFLLNEVMQ